MNQANQRIDRTPGKTRLRFAVVLVAGAGHAQRWATKIDVAHFGHEAIVQTPWETKDAA
jgi:hypothetical protein